MLSRKTIIILGSLLVIACSTSRKAPDDYYDIIDHSAFNEDFTFNTIPFSSVRMDRIHLRLFNKGVFSSLRGSLLCLSDDFIFITLYSQFNSIVAQVLIDKNQILIADNIESINLSIPFSSIDRIIGVPISYNELESFLFGFIHSYTSTDNPYSTDNDNQERYTVSNYSIDSTEYTSTVFSPFNSSNPISQAIATKGSDPILLVNYSKQRISSFHLPSSVDIEFRYFETDMDLGFTFRKPIFDTFVDYTLENDFPTKILPEH